MSDIIETAKEYLKEHQWFYDESEPGSLEFWDHRMGSNTVHKCSGHVEEDFFYITAVLPNLVPKEKYPVVLELINRFNSGLILACLELHTEAGHLGVRHSVYLADDRISPNLIDCLVRQTVYLADTIFPLATSVIAGACSAEDAVSQFQWRHQYGRDEQQALN